MYNQLQQKYQAALTGIKRKYNFISLLRLTVGLLFLVNGFYGIKNERNYHFYIGLLLVLVFIIILRLHKKVDFQRKLTQNLLSINVTELEYLNQRKLPFENGTEYIDFKHEYAYDLDIFGNDSLFQHLNRTATWSGKTILAKQLLKVNESSEIIENQEAIQELSQNLSWRQDFTAHAKLNTDSEKNVQKLTVWSTQPSVPISKGMYFISWVTPVLFLGALTAYFITKEYVFLSLSSFIFVLNLGLLGQFFKRIMLENAHSESIDKTLLHYSILLQKIEQSDFKAAKLQKLKKDLLQGSTPISDEIKKLSELFGRLDSIGNLVTTPLFNGVFLFHIHTLKALIDWKTKNGQHLMNAIAIIGEVEMLTSLANFSYNNPDYVFPKLNDSFAIQFKNVSHPLLNKLNRVGNEVDFSKENFIILTGSNMSGKSTFLRSVGINMVLAGTGAPVCASQANIHPLKVLVSMRLSDSLSDSTSYFFAEIKRLKQIMDSLQCERSFVLLDEILRGTNSDDKRNGTIEVIKKMIAKNAIGVIATHDTEVCLTAQEFPQLLVNKCFEVAIVDNELFFDYKLRDGICQNKSATFLMKKMEVI
ncbi:DNA mismatch repair protein [Flavobacterium sp.]|uniref:MutS-related protein n=1 Tax=Flavobacterium sp. TaxID=239 RepID=UPI00260C6073|nr:DNA mismatch repair protein [Flavobacterium sp.]MDD3004945.1 DNA mismatch repair protein [Flavobacterium sp.]